MLDKKILIQWEKPGAFFLKEMKVADGCLEWTVGQTFKTMVKVEY